MSDEVTVLPDQVSRRDRVACGLTGHTRAGRVVRAGDVMRDDGENHVYAGCTRCGKRGE